ncbi:MAG: RNA-binding domain-containing protein [Candidatus Desantisbacteria bacterium]
MITKEKLLEMLSDLESARIERTIATKDTDKFSQAVCAFANDMSDSRETGYLIVGINDNGNPSGLTVTDQLLQNLAALRSDGNILPLPAITVEKVALPDGEVAVVEVLPSDIPPVRYKGQVWIQVVPRKAIASEQEERILTEKRIARSHSFDSLPMQDAGISNISIPIFHDYRGQVIAKDVIDANNRTVEEQLASLRFFDVTRNCVTTAGILLFGVNPRFYLPGAYVQFLRFQGTTMTDLPLDQMEISGTLPVIANILRDKFRSYNRMIMKNGNPQPEFEIDAKTFLVTICRRQS